MHENWRNIVEKINLKLILRKHSHEIKWTSPPTAVTFVKGKLYISKRVIHWNEAIEFEKQATILCECA